ncbi:MAG: L,D-transpeptidase [Pyrinomonadaceae bacterium]
MAISLLLVLQGCVPPQPNGGNSSANISNSINSNTAAPKAENTAVEPDQAVTLPVLNAMFSDEAFSPELKTQFQLTDEQIEKLKTAAQESVANLDETEENTDGARSTRTALQTSIQKVGEIIGQENSAKFFDFVKQRWSNTGEQVTQTSEPGKIPTDTRIVVNAPAYRMDLFKDGKLVKSYKVGIGYPEFPLPQGMRKAETIIFNPTWTPPDEPWVKGKVKAGETVKAGDKLNPLGPIKIPIGLPSLIHGGKSPAKLGTFASHGCVGLTSPLIQDFSLELAKISGTELTQEDVRKFEKQKTETKNFKLENSIPVELRYETIVVEDGKLKIFRDVYEKGTNTEENLRRVFDAYGVSFDSLPPEQKTKILEGLNQMAYNAQGIKVEATQGNGNTNINSNKTDNENSNSGNGSVTRTLKGKKEIMFEIVELKGKGYPAPLNINK